MTERSNIQSPSLDTATPLINVYAAPSLLGIQIEARHTTRQLHCAIKILVLRSNENDD